MKTYQPKQNQTPPTRCDLSGRRPNTTCGFIAALLASGLLATGPASAALIAHYEFEGDYTDSTGNGHTGITVGSGSLVSDPERGNVYYNPTTTSPRSYLNIDGTVAIPTLSAGSGLTLALWVRRDIYTAGTNALFGPGNLVAALALGTGGDAPIATIGVNNNGGITSFIEGDGGADQVHLLSADGLVADEAWTHLAVTFDRPNDIARIYVNGIQAGSDFDISIVGDGALDWAGANVGTLAAPGNVNFDFQGRIDDARIYYEVLDGAAIAALVPEPSTSLLLLLPLSVLIGRRRRRQGADSRKDPAGSPAWPSADLSVEPGRK